MPEVQFDELNCVEAWLFSKQQKNSCHQSLPCTKREVEKIDCILVDNGQVAIETGFFEALVLILQASSFHCLVNKLLVVSK